MVFALYFNNLYNGNNHRNFVVGCVGMENIIKFDFKSLEIFDKIYVLVSGGFDSTYLYEIIKKLYPEKTYPTNCYNPYEYNKTLKKIEGNDENFLKIEPKNYKDIIKESFLKLPEAYKLKEKKKYHKKIFPCCYILKHKNFKKDKRFKEANTVVISGIKWGDGKQRRLWLSQLHNRDQFYHRHQTGELYCYPYRDYSYYELPDDIKNELWKKYPYLEHSGCSLCPVLVLFNLIGEGKRYERSLQYAKQLGVFPYKDINEFIEIKQ